MAKYKQEYIFGIRAVIEALNQNKDIDKVMVLKSNGGDLFHSLLKMLREKNIAIQYVPIDVFKPFSDRNHQGVLAEISPVPYADINIVIQELETKGNYNPFILILDKITDVRNFGAIVRTALCAGVDAVVIPNKNSAKISSDAIKTSSGAMYHIPICRVQNLKKLVRTFIYEKGMKVYAANEKSEKIYTDVDMKQPMALVMGAEDRGVDEELLKVVSDSIKIPQRGELDSLNVSVATAVILYEVVRQRNL